MAEPEQGFMTGAVSVTVFGDLRAPYVLTAVILVGGVVLLLTWIGAWHIISRTRTWLGLVLLVIACLTCYFAFPMELRLARRLFPLWYGNQSVSFLTWPRTYAIEVWLGAALGVAGAALTRRRRSLTPVPPHRTAGDNGDVPPAGSSGQHGGQ